MTNDRLMNEFLNHAAQHLLNNRHKFLEKLENGDITAIKMLLDFISKTAPKTKKNAQPPVENNNIEDMKYEQAFETLKDALEEKIDQQEEE